MGQAKDRASEIEAIKKQETERQKKLEELAKREAEERAKIDALAKTPIAKDEADKMFADNKIKLMQLTIIRNKWGAQMEALQHQLADIRQRINAIDNEMYNIQLEDTITFRRTLNAPSEGSEG